MKKILTQEHNCFECKYGSPACVGGYLCEKSGEIVIMDFMPTEHYCKGEEYEDEQR